MLSKLLNTFKGDKKSKGPKSPKKEKKKEEVGFFSCVFTFIC